VDFHWHVFDELLSLTVHVYKIKLSWNVLSLPLEAFHKLAVLQKKIFFFFY